MTEIAQSKPQFGAVVILPDGTGSNGDLGMLLGMLQLLEKQGRRQVHVIHPRQGTSCKPLVERYTRLDVEEEFLELGQIAGWITEPCDLFVIGADVVDGSYGDESGLARIHAARQALELGGCAIFLSFSYAGLNPVVNRAFMSICHADFLVRDSESHARFLQHTNCPAAQAHDLAFFCPVDESARVAEIKSQIEAARRQGYAIVGVNISVQSLMFMDTEKSMEKYRELTETVLDQILRVLPNAYLVFIPNDIRSWENHPSDCELLEFARDHCRRNYPDTGCVTIPGDVLYPETLALVRGLDVLYTGRMHLTIAAVRGNVPVVSVEYNSKFMGFQIDHIGFEKQLLVRSLDAVGPALKWAFENRLQIRREMSRRFKGQMERHSYRDLIPVNFLYRCMEPLIGLFKIGVKRAA